MANFTENKSGEWVNITFEGRQLRVKKGQSLAGALLAQGIFILGRSFKFHRPRGYYCGKGYCNNCAMTVDGLPNVLSCEHHVVGGEIVRRERGWPSTRFDVLGVLGLFGRWLRPGFQKGLFPKHPALAKVAMKLVSNMAGGNRLPAAAAAQGQIRIPMNKRADVLVVGGGLSGCLAALGAANTGAHVLLVQRGSLGGRSLLDPGSVASDAVKSADKEVISIIDDVRRNPNIEVIEGTAIGYFEDDIVPVLTATHLLECFAQKLIVATGSNDQSALFAGNDKPNVILADGVLQLVAAQNIVPWRRAVILTDSARGYRLLNLLRQHGVDVVAVVDKSDPENRGVIHKNEAATASVAVNGYISSVNGLGRVKRVNIETDQGKFKYRVDLVCVALSPRPSDALWHQWCRAHPESRAMESNGVVWQESATSGTALAKVGSAAGWQNSQTRSAAFDVGKEVALAPVQHE